MKRIYVKYAVITVYVFFKFGYSPIQRTNFRLLGVKILKTFYKITITNHLIISYHYLTLLSIFFIDIITIPDISLLLLLDGIYPAS